MEADWEVEIGDGAPVIDACWQGLIDLRQAPERAFALPEAKQLPALADTLARLNAPSSPVWTSKCDVWRPEALDANELDAPPGAATCGLACYVDLVTRNAAQWADPMRAADWCAGLCACLRPVDLRSCRADLIVRRAFLAPDCQGAGVTIYLTACGAAPAAAHHTLAAALATFAEALLHMEVGSKLQWKNAGE